MKSFFCDHKKRLFEQALTTQHPLFFEVAMGVSLAYAEQARQLFYRHDFGAAEFGINFVQLSHFNLVYLCICYKCLIIIY